MRSTKLQLDHSWYEPLIPLATTRTQIAASLLDPHYQKVLDLGCSNGYFLLRNQSHFDTAIGLDLSRSAIKQASRQAQKASQHKFRFKAADLNRPLRYQSSSFNLVISLSTIEYLQDPHHFLSQVHKVLKPNGQLIIHTMNLAFVLRRLQLLFGHMPTFNASPGWQGGVLHNFTYHNFTKLLQDHHFKILDSRCSGLLPASRLWAKNLLCSDIIIKAQKI